MNSILTIIRRELGSTFTSPVATTVELFSIWMVPEVYFPTIVSVESESTVATPEALTSLPISVSPVIRTPSAKVIAAVSLSA